MNNLSDSLDLCNTWKNIKDKMVSKILKGSETELLNAWRFWYPRLVSPLLEITVLVPRKCLPSASWYFSFALTVMSWSVAHMCWKRNKSWELWFIRPSSEREDTRHRRKVAHFLSCRARSEIQVSWLPNPVLLAQHHTFQLIAPFCPVASPDSSYHLFK